jgi:FkbM family methyltransferase
MSWCTAWLKLGSSPQTVIDCGANIGYFSAILAQQCDLKRAIAIEGNPKTAHLCRKTLKVLNLEYVELIQAILADHPTESYVIPDQPGREPWQQAIKADSAQPDQAVRTLTLDNLVLDLRLQPDLIKIDCEGFETLILRGAIKTLKAYKPALMVECNDRALQAAGSDRRELFGVLRSLGYQLFHLASFTDYHPAGIAIAETFPSSEFNFAAISSDDESITRWHDSMKSIAVLNDL